MHNLVQRMIVARMRFSRALVLCFLASSCNCGWGWCRMEFPLFFRWSFGSGTGVPVQSRFRYSRTRRGRAPKRIIVVIIYIYIYIILFITVFSFVLGFSRKTRTAIIIFFLRVRDFVHATREGEWKTRNDTRIFDGLVGVRIRVPQRVL